MPHLRIHDIELYYERTGHGEPLLLLNGLGGDTRSMEPLARRLSRHFTVISFDARGAGQSEKPDEPYTICQMAADAQTLLKTICGGDAHVLGFSMGGAVAIEFALRWPQCVKSLSLVSTFPAWLNPHPVSDRVRAMLHRTDISEELLTEVFETIFGPRFRQRIRLESYLKLRLEDTQPQPAFAYLRQLDAVERFDRRAELSRITVPTLIVAGRNDQVVPIEQSEWMHAMIPHSDLTILRDVGHMVPLEAPKELAELMIKNA